VPSLPESLIHATAVVSPKARLGEGVSIGPYAVVEAGAEVGDGTVILAHAVLTGHATLGRGVEVHYGAVIGHEPQDLGFDGATSRARVGDRTVVREHATIHRGTRDDGDTTVGEGCLLMAGAHVGHDCRIGRQVVLCNSALVAGHCEIGSRAFLSGNTVVHQFARVGDLVMLSGASGVGRDVGPYLMVAGRSEVVGLNVVGMRRAGLGSEARARVKEAYRRLFGVPSLEAGLAGLEALDCSHPEIQRIHDFYTASSRRGFSRPPPGHAWTEGQGD
jgi:UDP-N-acetylglucosamine acyltransferase